MSTTRGILLIGALLVVLAAGAQAQTTAFTYQGQITNAGAPANGNYDLQIALYDAVTGGTLLGTVTQTLPVVNGLFTATLDFGYQFPGASRWLEISVRPSGVGGYTLLSPRQPVTPAPYAIGLELPYAGTANPSSNVFAVTNTGTGAGVAGTSTVGTVVNNAGVVGTSTATDGNGVAGFADTGTAAYGVYGEANQGIGMYGFSNTGTGLYASSATGVGAHGLSGSAEGVLGESNTGPGVHGINSSSTLTISSGVVGESRATDGNGVAGFADYGTNAYGVYGEARGGGYAGYFNGNVNVLGYLSKGGGSFKIDDPLDPANKYLYHSFVESPDMMNVYNGNVTTDGAGYATVTLPNWFGVLNRDFRYQLTVIDDNDSPDFVQAKIVSRISNNQFRLRSSKPQTTVSWQVTGIRQDPWANAHRIPVEQDKPARDRGRYLYPDLYGQPPEMSVAAAKLASAGTPNRPAPTPALPANKVAIVSPASAAPGRSR